MGSIVGPLIFGNSQMQVPRTELFSERLVRRAYLPKACIWGGGEEGLVEVVGRMSISRIVGMYHRYYSIT